MADEETTRAAAQAAVVRGGRQPKRDAPFNAGSAKDVKARDARLERESVSRDRDLRHLISLPAFQRFVIRLMEDSKAFERSWDTSKRRLIQEGRAMLALEVWQEIESTNPSAVVKIMDGRLAARNEATQ